MASVRCRVCSLNNRDGVTKCVRCGESLSPAEPGGGVWREGDVLVVKKDAALPDRCVRCNGRADGAMLKQKYQWHHPALYILAPFALLIYALVALVIRKTATLHVGICRQHLTSRKRGHLGSALLAIAGVVSLFVAIEGGGFFGWGGLTLLLAAAVWGTIGTRLLSVKGIDDHFVRLTGAHPAYLSSLPAWGALR